LYREHPADEVYVTGTFDNWTKSVRLEKEGDIFSKTVDLKEPEGKIYYKVRQRQRATTRNANKLLSCSLPIFTLHLTPFI
jgi:hypothetical protein